MFKDLSQLARSKKQPGEFRHFGSGDNPAFLREVLQSSWIPKRKDRASKEKPKADPSPATDVQEAQKTEVVISFVPEPVVLEPAPEPGPEPRRAPPALMSRQAMGKAMKAARKTAQAKAAHPRMRSTGQLPKLRRRTDAAKPQKRPKAPPFELNDSALSEAAQRALNGFTQRQRRVEHTIEVMAAMLDPRAKEDEYERLLLAHAFGVLQSAIEEARLTGTNIDRRFLHARCSRAFGQLIALAWKRFKRASIHCQARRRGGASVWRFNEEGMDIYFVVKSEGRLPPIHFAMGERRFVAWMKGHLCCEPSPRKRSRM